MFKTTSVGSQEPLSMVVNGGQSACGSGFLHSGSVKSGPRIHLRAEARGVDVLQRVVPDVRISVVALPIERRLDDRIGREEPPGPRVVDSTLHVDQALLEVLLVAGEPRRSRLLGGVSPRVLGKLLLVLL